MLLDSLVWELWRGEQAHGLKSQVAEVRFPVAQKLSELVASANEKVWLAEKCEMNLSP